VMMTASWNVRGKSSRGMRVEKLLTFPSVVFHGASEGVAPQQWLSVK